MHAWQIRNILTTIALAACCGVATAAPEPASPGQQPASSGVKSETKQTTTGVRSASKQSTKGRGKNGGAKATAPAKTAKATPPVKTEKATVPANTAKAADVRPRVRITGGTLNVITAPDVGLHAIKDRARWAPGRPCADTDEKLKGTVVAIDKEASRKGDGAVSERMAAQFRTPTEAILAERTRLNAGWGELVVAHTFLANVQSGITIDHLFEMRDEGMGWGRIAYGLGLRQKDVATAVRAEGRVIRGQSKPNGSPSPIASVEVGIEETVRPGTPTSEAGAGDAGTSGRGAVQK